MVIRCREYVCIVVPDMKNFGDWHTGSGLMYKSREYTGKHTSVTNRHSQFFPPTEDDLCNNIEPKKTVARERNWQHYTVFT